jgi:hypothetical protein
MRAYGAIMLEKLIEIAVSKAVESLASKVFDYKLLDKVKGHKKIQYKMIYKKAEILKSLREHLHIVDAWSKSIDILGMPRPKNLDDIYIHLSFTDDPRRMRFGEGHAEMPTYDIEDALTFNKHIVILGDPGSGKTTTLKKIANEFLRRGVDVDKNHYTPVVVRFRDFKENTSLLNTLKQIFDVDFVEIDESANERSGVKSSELSNQERLECFYTAQVRALSAFLDEMKIFLLFDGFDELHPDARQRVLKHVEALGVRLSKSRIILTSRSADFIRKPENFLTFEINKLSDNKIKRFTRLWFSSNFRRKTAEEFLTALENTPYKDLSSRPLTLTTLCLVFEKYGSLPELPISIYRKAINLLLEEWDAERGVVRISHYARFDAHRKMDFLAAFAYHLVLGKYSSLSFRTSDLVSIYATIHARFGLPPGEAVETALEIESHTGIIVRTDYETYEFSHKSLQEFLVAEHLVRLRDVPSNISLLKNCPNELAISVALSSDSTDWLCGIFRDKGKRIRPDPPWTRTFLFRLLLEKPSFDSSAELGATLMWLLSRRTEYITDELLHGMAGLDGVSSSIQSYLQYCSTLRRPDSADSIFIRRKGKIPAKYTVPEQIEISRVVLERLSTAFDFDLQIQ